VDPAEVDPAPRDSQRLPHNLPLELSSFIGREREMDEIKRLLTETRLLTLTGPGGSGKTRLALKVARDLVKEFEDGVWLVELASLSDEHLVPQTVASALRVRERPDQSLTDILIEHLKPKKLLLILDNVRAPPQNLEGDYRLVLRAALQYRTDLVPETLSILGRFHA
jgi:hypothetical protein